MKNKKDLFNYYLIILGLSFSLLGLWGNLRADCIANYQDKIAGKQTDGTFKKIFYPASRYQDTLDIIVDSITENNSEKWKKFEQDLRKTSFGRGAVAPSTAEIMNIIRGLNEKKLLCEPKVLPYKDLVSQFATLAMKMSEESRNVPVTENMDPLSKRKFVIREMEKDYRLASGCGPYKNSFDFDLDKIRNLAIQGVNPLLVHPGRVDTDGDKDDCLICAEEKAESEFFTFSACGCDGKACKDCVHTDFAGKLKEGSCPQECMFCKGKLDPRQLYQAGILNEEEVVLWKLRELKGAAFTNHQFVPCDTPGCEMGFFQGTPGYRDLLAKGCPACGSKAKKCALCGKDRHPGKSCEQVWMDWVKECEQMGASACPTCWAPIQHAGACMHMTCPKCKTDYSEITKLPMEKDKVKREKEYDEGGWPLKYFYPGGIYSANGRRDQKGRTIDIYGNLIKEIPRPVKIDGTWEWIPTWTVISRDGKRYFHYDSQTNRAWLLKKDTFEKVQEVPQQEFHQFKGEWDRIVQQVKRDQAKKK